VKAIITRRKSERAYTIIELLTVMSIVIVLIGLLVPALSVVKKYGRKVKQRAQFHAIDVAMELFSSEFEGYPDSEELDQASTPANYCGAMKLCEAMMGQDLLGFHPDSDFRADCQDSAGKFLYDNPSPTSFNSLTATEKEDNLMARRGPFLQRENANGYRLRNIYGTGNTTSTFTNEELFVLCDVYANVINKRNTGERGKTKIGMPILYYKANPAGTTHLISSPPGTTLPTAYYDYKDNYDLIKLGVPFNPNPVHKLGGSNANTGSPVTVSDADAEAAFINITKDNMINISSGAPFRSDSYILISAGNDGLYGTRDDVFNFDK